jgi:hypothetical protein
MSIVFRQSSYILSCFGILLLSVFSLAAQPMNGTYTVGSGSANYSSLNTALAALQLNGVNGPVIIQIDSGIYQEQLAFGSINGSSTVNTITFKGIQTDSTQVRLRWPSSASSLNNHVVDFQNSSHIRFESMSIERIGQADYARVINLAGNCQNLRFSSCQFTGVNSTNAGLHQILVYGVLNSGQRNITVENCLLYGGNFGIFILGPGQFSRSTHITIHGCRFENQFGGSLRLSYFASPLQILQNQIFSQAANTAFNAIHLDNCANDYRIEANFISLKNGTAIKMALSSGYSIQIALIANNIVSTDSSSGPVGPVSGISISNSATLHIYHNSIQLEESAGATCLILNGIACSNIGIVNNNFQAGSGLVFDIDTTPSSPINSSHHNNVWGTGPVLIRRGTSTFYPDLASYQSATSFEQGSVSLKTNYIQGGPGHNTPELDDAGSGALSNLTPVNSDFYGNPRNTSYPDIGAVEFEHFRMGIDALVLDSTLCTGDSTVLKVRLKNYGPGPFIFQFSGAIRVDSLSTMTWPVQPPVAIAGGDTLLLTYPLALQFGNDPTHLVNTKFSFEFNPPANLTDSLESDTIRIRPPYTGFLGSDTTICLSHSLLISPTQSFASYYWSNGSSQPFLQINPNSLPAGSYPVILSGNDEYCTSSDTMTLTIDPCHGLQENIPEVLRVYPNPAVNLITLNLPEGGCRIEIRDAAGRLVWSSNTTQSTISIDINNLRQGYHQVHVINSSAYLHCSFVKLW